MFHKQAIVPWNNALYTRLGAYNELVARGFTGRELDQVAGYMIFNRDALSSEEREIRQGWNKK